MGYQDGMLLHRCQEQDVSEWLQDILKGQIEQPKIVAYISTCDITRKSDDVLQSGYRELGRRFKIRTSITGLPLEMYA